MAQVCTPCLLCEAELPTQDFTTLNIHLIAKHKVVKGYDLLIKLFLLSKPDMERTLSFISEIIIEGKSSEDYGKARSFDEDQDLENTAAEKSFNELLEAAEEESLGHGDVFCSDCGEIFISKKDLTFHKTEHHTNSLFTCKQCGERFSRRSNLDVHIEAMHISEDQTLTPDDLDYSAVYREIYHEVQNKPDWYEHFFVLFSKRFPYTSVPTEQAVCKSVYKHGLKVIPKVEAKKEQENFDVMNACDNIPDEKHASDDNGAQVDTKMKSPYKEVKPEYSVEQKTFCLEIYQNLVGKSSWHKELSQLFQEKFPQVSIPTPSTIHSYKRRFDKGKSLEKTKPPGLPFKNVSRICDECGFEVTNQRRKDMAMTRHKQQHHQAWDECPDCRKKVPKLRMKDHQRSHLTESEKEFKCEHCGKNFARKHGLKNHYLSVHLDDRPHVCQYLCGYACKSAGNLRKHEIICKKK